MGAHLVGQRVGEYEIVRRIGLGGMGAVYEGRHPFIGKRVAVKVLLPELSDDEAVVKRFMAEARTVNAIRHRGIVDVFGFGQLPDGAHYFVMEFLEGLSFQALLAKRKALPVGEALSFMDEILDAVAAAHQAGVVHRDLKPSNVFLVDTGRGRPWVKLLDFGVAKNTAGEGTRGGAGRTGIVGTPAYMAPEQITGELVGPWTDLYALGVMLFEMVAGRQPFQGDSPVMLMGQHLEQAPPRLAQVAPGVPLELDALVNRLLAKRGAERPQHADAVRADLARIRAAGERGPRPVEIGELTDLGPTVVRPAPAAELAGPAPHLYMPDQARSKPQASAEPRQRATPGSDTDPGDASRARTRIAVSGPVSPWDLTDRNLPQVPEPTDAPPRPTGPASALERALSAPTVAAAVVPETTVPEARPLALADSGRQQAVTDRAPALDPGPSTLRAAAPVQEPAPRRVSVWVLIVVTVALMAVGALLGLALLP